MAEVMRQYVEPEEVLEPGLQGRLPRQHHHTTTTITADDMVASNESATNGEYEGKLEKSVYLDNDEGERDEWSISGANPRILQDLDVKLVDSDIGKVLNAFINAQDDEIKPHDPNSRGERGHEEINSTEEYDEEEVIELEFERAIKKLDTHTMHCPKCNTQVTKVILRRKRIRVAPKQHKPLNLIGCLPCLSVFVPSGNCLNMFGIFRTPSKKPQEAPLLDESISSADENTSPSIIPSNNGNVVIQEKGGCFGLFGIFSNKYDNQSIKNPVQTSTVDISHSPSDTGYANSNKVIEQDQGQYPKQKDKVPTGSSNYQNGGPSGQHVVGPPPPGVIRPGDVRLDIPDELDESTPGPKLLEKPDRGIGEMQNGTAQTEEGNYRNQDEGGPLLVQQTDSRAEREGPSNDQDSKSIEIVKSIVYGGLMESITSLSVVASAAAADATTLNIIALGFANLIGGIFIIGHNLWDLKDDHANPRANKYQELLGRRENFPLHATLAILSFLVFGLVPPVTYGFSFRLSDDRDFKILAVAAASLLCVILLAVGKAYAQKTPTFYKYMKTIMYYVTTAFAVSGVSYATGHLAKKFIDELGLFDTNSPAALSLPGMNSVNPILASY